MSILGEAWDSKIKGFEGWAPRAQWDYKQHTNGWGTRALRPGEMIDQAEAQRRYDAEIAKAHGIVRGFAPGLDDGTTAALTSLTFNAGADWTKSGLGQAIKAGNLDEAKKRFVQYVNAGGQPNQGLANRRNAEVGWIGSGAPDMAKRERDYQWNDVLPMEEQAQPAPPQVAGFAQRAQQPEQQAQPSTMDRIMAGFSNPMFQQGLGLLLASYQGKDMNQGMSAGSERASALQQAMLKNYQLQQQMDREKKMKALLGDANKMAGVDPRILAMSQITGDPAMVADTISRQAQQGTPMAQAQLALTQAQAKKASAEAEDGGFKMTEVNGQLVRVNRDGTTQVVFNGSDQTEQRRKQIIAAGLDPTSGSSKTFIATGKMPREDQQPLTATDKKAILEADESVTSAETAIAGLREALNLSPSAYYGIGAGARGYLGSLVGAEGAAATEGLNNVVTTTALNSLKSIFGGNPTEGERKILLDIQGSAGKAPQVREDIYRRAIQMAERRLDFNKQRSSALRGQTYYKSDAAKAAPVQQPTPQPGNGWSIQRVD